MSYQVVIPLGFVWQKPGRIQDWIDGDSAHVYLRESPEVELDGLEIRVEGINAIELHAQYGAEALAAANLIAPAGTQFMFTEHKREKYGRRLGRLLLPDGSDFGTRMLLQVASGVVPSLAVPYLT